MVKKEQIMVQGATYTKSSTFFCLFSPIADEVILCLYDDGDCGTEKQTFPMTKGQGKDKDLNSKSASDLSEDLFKVHDFDVKIDLQVPSSGK